MSNGARKPVAMVPFSRLYRTDEIHPKGIAGGLEMNARERVATAAVLDLKELKSFRMDFQLRRSAPGRFKLSGHLLADVVQTCVVTLEPVESSIDERFEAEFWPPEDLARLESSADQDGMTIALEGPEPLEEEGIDAGRLAYEQLAAALDPYPRKPGAEFAWQEARGGDASEAGDSPFSELTRLSILKKHSQTEANE